MTVKGVVFDLGSTLMYFHGDWEVAHVRNLANLLAFLHQQGLDLEEDRFLRTYNRQKEKAWETARATWVEYPEERSLAETLVELGYPGLNGHLLADGVRALFRYEEACWTAFPDALPTLQTLQDAGYRLGLISNASDDALIQRLTRRLGLTPYLHPALNSAGVGIRKPDTRVFQMVLEEWRLGPDEVVMVGDTLEADIQGARLAGMRGVLALMDENPENEEFCHSIIPDAAIQHLAELPPLLATW